jgi:hypothetical protein
MLHIAQADVLVGAAPGRDARPPLHLHWPERVAKEGRVVSKESRRPRSRGRARRTHHRTSTDAILGLPEDYAGAALCAARWRVEAEEVKSMRSAADG